MNETSEVLEAKKALRARIKMWREGLSADAMARAAEAVAVHGLGFLRLAQPGTAVSGFSSLPDEFRARSAVFFAGCRVRKRRRSN